MSMYKPPRRPQFFYTTAPLPCPYLAGRTERKVVTEIVGPDAEALHDRLSRAGFRRSHNIAYSPYVWRRIIETWDGAVGMNFDPSHLVWQMIDQARFIREFGAHMLHVHAKDLMIDRDGLYERGIMSAGMGWQVPRMPGLGDVNWNTIFSGLYRAGYDGPVIIEHEDRRFEGSDEAVKRGFLLARDVLRPFVK